MNRRTGFRHQASFRRAFPMLDTPAQIYAGPAVRETLHKRADFGDKLDNKHTLTRELAAVEIGVLPATL